MWLLRETDVTAHLLDESIKGDWNFFKGKRCIQTYVSREIKDKGVRDKFDTRDVQVNVKQDVVKGRHLS